VSSVDESDSTTVCVPLKDVELAAKLSYYAARALKILTELPVPPPP
jgi:hypothetical protein